VLKTFDIIPLLQSHDGIEAELICVCFIVFVLALFIEKCYKPFIVALFNIRPATRIPLLLNVLKMPAS
jgi:hypothetical protein